PRWPRSWAGCRSPSAPAPAPSCAARSASRSWAAFCSPRCSRSTRRRWCTWPSIGSPDAAGPPPRRIRSPPPRGTAHEGLTAMNIAEPFIRRPAAPTLLSGAVLLAGTMAYRVLPVAPLPQVEFPVIQVQANLPGASPETMAASVATPLERSFGRIAGITEMTSTSLLGNTTIVLQFDLNRNIDAAARDVQAAINAARTD